MRIITTDEARKLTKKTASVPTNQYAKKSDTKYHIGDHFIYGEIVAVITTVSDTDETYTLTFLNKTNRREILIPVKKAWWNNTELDNFKQTFDTHV